MVEREFLTVAQVAERLQVTAQTIRNWIDQGVLPAIRVGRAYRIRPEDVDELFDRAQAESESIAARRDSWRPQLWRLPRDAADKGESVWDETAVTGLARRDPR